MAVGGQLQRAERFQSSGDVVVVEDHQRRDMRQRPRHAGQAIAEGFDVPALAGEALRAAHPAPAAVPA